MKVNTNNKKKVIKKVKHQDQSPNALPIIRKEWLDI